MRVATSDSESIMTRPSLSNDADPNPARLLARTTAALVLVALAAFLALGHRGLPGLSATGPAERDTPLLVRDGNRISVPPDSPVRTKLAIEPVVEKEIEQRLVLPAVVEADPGHTVKVLPPLAGRIVEVKVQLGERVEVGQPLSVLDS